MNNEKIESIAYDLLLSLNTVFIVFSASTHHTGERRFGILSQFQSLIKRIKQHSAQILSKLQMD